MESEPAMNKTATMRGKPKDAAEQPFFKQTSNMADDDGV